MDAPATAALVLGGLALARHALLLPPFLLYLRRARVSSIPKGPTPPISLVKPLRDVPGLEENLVATLRQNYPEFEVVFEGGDEAARAAAEAAARAVPDVPVRSEPGHGIVVRAGPSVRPDPLHLRDVANGLAAAGAVSFVPVLFGMRSFGARLAGLLADTELLLAAVAGRGKALTGETVAARGGAPKGAGLARRAERLFAPDAGPATVIRAARRLRTTLPVPHALALVSSLAPALLLAAPTAAGLWMLAAHTAVRALVAAIVDLRFCWDRSLARALPLLPLLWVYEPLCLAASFAPGDRATLVPH